MLICSCRFIVEIFSALILGAEAFHAGDLVRLNEARTLLSQSLSFYVRKFGDLSIVTAPVYEEYGVLYRLSGDFNVSWYNTAHQKFLM